MSGVREGGTGLPFVNGYFDKDTGRRLSEKEAHIRKSSYHKDLASFYRKHGEHEKGENEELRAEYYRDIAKTSSTSTDPNNGHCYISTACVEAEGLPDDCLELQTLRNFRDNYLANQPRGRELIQEYYSIAPRIVSTINRKPDAHEIFCGIFNRDITTAVEMVQKGDNEGALEHYMQMTNRLKSEFIN